jgi:hypothetical protein
MVKNKFDWLLFLVINISLESPREHGHGSRPCTVVEKGFTTMSTQQYNANSYASIWSASDPSPTAAALPPDTVSLGSELFVRAAILARAELTLFSWPHVERAFCLERNRCSLLLSIICCTFCMANIYQWFVFATMEWDIFWWAYCVHVGFSFVANEMNHKLQCVLD